MTGVQTCALPIWVMQKAKATCPVKRLWISSMTDEAIREGFEQNIEFERCIDFLVRMIDKYGAEVLRELEEEKQNKEEKEAAVS